MSSNLRNLRGKGPVSFKNQRYVEIEYHCVRKNKRMKLMCEVE